MKNRENYNEIVSFVKKEAKNTKNKKKRCSERRRKLFITFFR